MTSPPPQGYACFVRPATRPSLQPTCEITAMPIRNQHTIYFNVYDTYQRFPLTYRNYQRTRHKADQAAQSLKDIHNRLYAIRVTIKPKVPSP